MNSYEEKQEAKRARLNERSKKLRAQSEAKFKEGTRALQAIPLGQPILIGHHSERSDRAYRGRAVRKIDKSFELAKQADQLEARADGIGSGGISSDDPDAVVKLEEKLLKAEEAHAVMVEHNREARANGQPKPWPTYALTNSGANIRRIHKRIEELKTIAAAPESDMVRGEGWTMCEEKEENRIFFIFDAIPTEQVRAILKSQAFKWSPIRKAWVRKITGNARFAAERVIGQLRAI